VWRWGNLPKGGLTVHGILLVQQATETFMPHRSRHLCWSGA
jgi:hypothetical protein